MTISYKAKFIMDKSDVNEAREKEDKGNELILAKLIDYLFLFISLLILLDIFLNVFSNAKVCLFLYFIGI